MPAVLPLLLGGGGGSWLRGGCTVSDNGAYRTTQHKDLCVPATTTGFIEVTITSAKRATKRGPSHYPAWYLN